MQLKLWVAKLCTNIVKGDFNREIKAKNCQLNDILYV